MPKQSERICQIRMSQALWNLVGELAQESGQKDGRGGHSEVIRGMIAATAAKWRHSPYVCRSARHTIYVTKEGNFFARHVQVLRLNSLREKLPCFIEMKPEKRGSSKSSDASVEEEYQRILKQWLINNFSVWSGRIEADELDSFRQSPLSSYVDTFGTTSKNADLAVHAVGGRFLTREIIVGLREYVQWKDPNSSSIFDRADIPIDIPTSDLEVSVVVDLDLFNHMDIEKEQIANLALEFRNRESARFEGKEVALYPEIGIEELYGRSPNDDGANETFSDVRRLRQRVFHVMENMVKNGIALEEEAKSIISESLRMPQNFLFYHLRWPSPHLGVEVCVRWEKPARGIQ